MSHKTLFLLFLALGIASCGGKVDMPRGNSRGHTSARLVDAGSDATFSDATERKVHGMIQRSIGQQFTANGMSWGRQDAGLVVAYMVIYQESSMTASYDDFFGHGREGMEIAQRAHQVGVIDNKRPDDFKRGAIVVDVIDAKTNKLIYRNFAEGDVVRGVSDDRRSDRIEAAITQALADFFKG